MNPTTRAAVRSLSRAAIVAVGSELLTPHMVDTNSLFLTEQLSATYGDKAAGITASSHGDVPPPENA